MPLTAQTPSRHLVDLVGALGGSWHGLTAMCRCPAHADRTPSLSLRQGDTGILVTCFAGCDREDVLRELSRVALSGHHPMPPPAVPGGTANVARLWDQAEAVGSSLAWRYLANRGFAHAPFDVRFHARCPHGPKPRTVFKPALLVAVREGRSLVALQRIFLDAADASSAAKVMLGRPGSGAWRGRGAGRVLAIAEGFETAEAFSVLHDIACWASLGARRLDQLVIPAPVELLLIAEDNDPEGRRASLRASDRYARPGLEIRRAPPPRSFKDWVDVLQERRRSEDARSAARQASLSQTA